MADVKIVDPWTWQDQFGFSAINVACFLPTS